MLFARLFFLVLRIETRRGLRVYVFKVRFWGLRSTVSLNAVRQALPLKTRITNLKGRFFEGPARVRSIS